MTKTTFIYSKQNVNNIYIKKGNALLLYPLKKNIRKIIISFVCYNEDDLFLKITAIRL